MIRKRVCVYTICKNEENNIDRWFESVKDADIICIVDTGSTDSTVEKIKQYMNRKDYNRIMYDTFIQEEFSFSVARNYALDLVKNHIIENIDLYKSSCTELDDFVFVSLDLDEFIEPDGINKIRLLWDREYDTIELCGKSIIIDKNGNESVESTSFVQHKIHSRHFYWERDVHEIIKRDGINKKDWIICNSPVSYNHIQDKNKERNYYQLLKNSFQKGDRSSNTLVYLAWEAYEHSDYEDMYKYASLGLETVLDIPFDENYEDFQYILCLKRYIALYYSNNKNWEAAYKIYLECIEIFAQGKFPRTRVIYMEIARVAWEIDKARAIMYYSQLFDIHCPEEYWVENFNLYTSQAEAELYSELSNAYFYSDLGYDYQLQSIFYAEIAYGLNNNNNVIKYNLEYIKNYFKK